MCTHLPTVPPEGLSTAPTLPASGMERERKFPSVLWNSVTTHTHSPAQRSLTEIGLQKRQKLSWHRPAVYKHTCMHTHAYSYVTGWHTIRQQQMQEVLCNYSSQHPIVDSSKQKERDRNMVTYQFHSVLMVILMLHVAHYTAIKMWPSSIVCNNV